MGELVELLEHLAEKGKRMAEYIVPGENEILTRRVQKETYRLSEDERLALVEKYGPPAEKAEKLRQKLRSAHWIKDEKKIDGGSLR